MSSTKQLTVDGANAVISYIHHYLENFGYGEKELILNADNCDGQNKNNIVIRYLCWRVITNLHNKIDYDFMLVGHTKLSPDRCFGKIKQNFQKRYVLSVFMLQVRLIRQQISTQTCRNLQVCRTARSLFRGVDWNTFLRGMIVKFPNISSYQHFRFNTNNPGIVYLRQLVRAPEISFIFLNRVSVSMVFHLQFHRKV